MIMHHLVGFKCPLARSLVVAVFVALCVCAYLCVCAHVC